MPSSRRAERRFVRTILYGIYYTGKKRKKQAPRPANSHFSRLMLCLGVVWLKRPVVYTIRPDMQAKNSFRLLAADPP
jgi:bacteriorhodopsin